LGNWWVNITLGSIDLFGTAKSIDILKPYMRHCGMSSGISLSRKLRVQETDASAIGTLVDFCGGIMQQLGNVSVSGSIIEKEITSCPFSSSSVETCKQMEFINQGLVEAINSDYEFAYDRMMTKGDETCHWTIRKKGEAAKEIPAIEASQDDPIKRLTNKYADGEITKEEYEEKMAIIEKHYPR
jgi:hypothetical protein